MSHIALIVLIKKLSWELNDKDLHRMQMEIGKKGL